MRALRYEGKSEAEIEAIMAEDQLVKETADIVDTTPATTKLDASLSPAVTTTENTSRCRIS